MGGSDFCDGQEVVLSFFSRPRSASSSSDIHCDSEDYREIRVIRRLASTPSRKMSHYGCAILYSLNVLVVGHLVAESWLYIQDAC